MGLHLNISRIDQSGFHPYGVLSQIAEGGKGEHSEGLVNLRPSASCVLYSVEAEVANIPFVPKVLEKHQFSSQTFIPLSCGEYLIMVALSTPEGDPDLQTLKAFRVPSSVVITYAPGTWHHPILSLLEPMVFSVLMWRDGTRNDETFLDLETHICLG